MKRTPSQIIRHILADTMITAYGVFLGYQIFSGQPVSNWQGAATPLLMIVSVFIRP